MDTLQLDPGKKYTYADYLTWLDDKSQELIDGFVKMMSPALSGIHQQESWNLGLILGDYLKNKKCRAFHVQFPPHGKHPDESINTFKLLFSSLTKI